MTEELPDTRLVARNPKNPWCDLGGEIVILSTGDHAYYRLDATGRALWLRLETPLTVSTLVTGLLGEYDAPEEQIARETRDFITRCCELNLLTIPDA